MGGIERGFGSAAARDELPLWRGGGGGGGSCHRPRSVTDGEDIKT